MVNKTQKCKGCKKELPAGNETGFCRLCYAKDYRKRNKEKIGPVSQKYYEAHKEEIKDNLVRWRDKTVFGGNMFKALERDNWECQACGMSQEQSIVLFNRKLVVHHIDGCGRNSEIKNHKLENLETLCPRCHGKICRKEQTEEDWKDFLWLLDQDDSEWKYPKIREFVDSKITQETNVTQAKRIVADELNISFWTVDGYYYQRKTQYKPEAKR